MKVDGTESLIYIRGTGVERVAGSGIKYTIVSERNGKEGGSDRYDENEQAQFPDTQKL